MEEIHVTTLDRDDLHIAGQLALVTAILTASGESDPKRARAEARRILRESILDVHELKGEAVIPGQ